MDFPFTVPRFDHIPLVLRIGLIRGALILHDGQPLEKVKGRRFVLHLTDGTSLILGLKTQGMDIMVPRVTHNDQVIQVAPLLPTFQCILAYSPLVLVFCGGAIGGCCGGVAAYFNLRVFHSSVSLTAKLALWLLVTTSAVIVWLILAVLLVSALRH